MLAFDGSRFRVGPQSAGANPGPASYRRGGPLAVTDANVLLGKIQPAWFPKVFGPDANEPLSVEAVQALFAPLAAQTQRPAEEVAEEVAAAVAPVVEPVVEVVEEVEVRCGVGSVGGDQACYAMYVYT